MVTFHFHPVKLPRKKKKKKKKRHNVTNINKNKRNQCNRKLQTVFETHPFVV